ncbi:ECF transporter S component [Romboutsia lituseburensis]|uniref:ECF transporter S component n=1 Tax=Romboutsia lituseburensis TaxID=1537 RepID=UPI00215ABF61|nr:ECF transporter S component [Romboutsia lituseburensis]MCR8743804.1 ECF transporter S component [Romboutsia lituseburensis]
MQVKFREERNCKFIKHRFKILILLITTIFPICLILYTKYDNRNYALISLLFITLSMIPFLMIYELKKPQAREWVPLAVMAALAAIGRVAFAPVPFFKPTSAIIIITASVFGPEAGFLTGAVSALSSNLFFGQGPWTPWQMFSWGIIGFLSGFLIKKNLINNKLKLYLFGGISGFIFGWIMNIWTATSFINEISSESFLSLYASSFPTDLIHSIATIIFLKYLYDPWRAKLKRVKVKFGLVNIE